MESGSYSAISDGCFVRMGMGEAGDGLGGIIKGEAMNDRELLGLAAKAAGIEFEEFDVMGNAVIDWHNNVRWNPLTDDGDAFRLAKRLGLTINFNDGMVRNQYEGLLAVSEIDIRIAIVRAAAAMAKTTA